jgi:hypothetical protein
MARKIAIFFLVSFVVLSTVYQFYTIYTFVHSGARFTLEDGRSLCARVLRLEAIQGATGGSCMFGSRSSETNKQSGD